MSALYLETNSRPKPFFEVVLNDLEDAIDHAKKNGQETVEVWIADLLWVLEPIEPTISGSLSDPEEFVEPWLAMIKHIDDCEGIYEQFPELFKTADEFMGSVEAAGMSALLPGAEDLDALVTWHKYLVDDPATRAEAYNIEDDPGAFKIRNELEDHEYFLSKAFAIPKVHSILGKVHKSLTRDIICLEVDDLEQSIPVIRIIINDWPADEDAWNTQVTLGLSCQDFEMDIEDQLDVLGAVADLLRPHLATPYARGRLGINLDTFRTWEWQIAELQHAYSKLLKYKPADNLL